MVQQQQQQHADRRAALDKREDFRLAKKSLKVIRAVCKEYGLAFKLPQDLQRFGGLSRARLT